MDYGDIPRRVGLLLSLLMRPWASLYYGSITSRFSFQSCSIGYVVIGPSKKLRGPHWCRETAGERTEFDRSGKLLCSFFVGGMKSSIWRSTSPCGPLCLFSLPVLVSQVLRAEEVGRKAISQHDLGMVRLCGSPRDPRFETSSFQRSPLNVCLVLGGARGYGVHPRG